jgi:hypothetical protein
MTLLKEIATRKDAISSLPALETAAFDKRAQRGEPAIKRQMKSPGRTLLKPTNANSKRSCDSM